MIKTLLLVCLFVVALPVLLLGLVIVPFMLLGLFLKAIFVVLLLPFRLLGAAVGLVATLSIGLAKGLAFLVTGLFGVLAFAGGVVLIGLAPLLLLVAGIWLLFRLARPRPAYS